MREIPIGTIQYSRLPRTETETPQRQYVFFTSFLFPPPPNRNRKIIVCNHWKFMSFTHSPVVVVEMSSDLQNRCAPTKKRIESEREKKSKNKYHSEVELSTRGLKVENFDFKYEIKFQLSKALLFFCKLKNTLAAVRYQNDTQNREYVCVSLVGLFAWPLYLSAASNICSAFSLSFQCYFLIEFNLI